MSSTSVPPDLRTAHAIGLDITGLIHAADRLGDRGAQLVNDLLRARQTAARLIADAQHPR